MRREKKMQSKLDQFFAVFIQPHVVYRNVCKAVHGWGTFYKKFDTWTSLS